MAEIQFRTIDAQEGPKLADWQRSYGVSEVGEFFVPALIAGGEEKVMMCASYDGILVATYKGHLYIPLSWAKKEFPEALEVWTAFENRMNELGTHFIR